MGRWKSGSGYWVIYKPEHPFANSNGCVPESRLIMEQHLGRYLTPDEHVHHMNRDILDNRIENLRCLTKSEHMSLEFKGNKYGCGNKGKGHRGVKPTDESKLKNRLAHLGKKHSEETRRKISQNSKRMWKLKRVPI